MPATMANLMMDPLEINKWTGQLIRCTEHSGSGGQNPNINHYQGFLSPHKHFLVINWFTDPEQVLAFEEEHYNAATGICYEFSSRPSPEGRKYSGRGIPRPSKSY